MMDRAMLLCCTQNDAMQVQRRLEHVGISARIRKLPRGHTARSCSWGVELARQDREYAARCLRKSTVHWQWVGEGRA